MSLELDIAFNRAAELILDQNNFVRAVLSGRRRNMQTTYERIDIRPVQLKDGLKLQLVLSEAKQDTTKNIGTDNSAILELLNSGYANILVEFTTGSYSLRITKKGEALIHEGKGTFERTLAHDRSKERLLDSSDPYLIEVGISDHKGVIKPSMQDKYRQVEEFLRLLKPTLDNEVGAQSEISIVDLGCGHAYLTFAVQEYLNSATQKVKVLGIDEREESKRHNDQIANLLGADAQFLVSKIADTPDQKVDIAIALHACDTATDDAIYWAVKNDAKVIMAAPCCMHELQTQIKDSPEPWELLTKYGLVKERLVDLITDSLRAQILKLLGFRVDIVEFIGGEHTARNILIRAVKTGALPTDLDKQRYQQMINDWQIKPYLAQLLADELKAAAQISRS